VGRVLNPVMRLFAGRVAGFAILTHRGRKTGRIHRTPINVFRQGDDYVFALTYGSDAEWVKNVLAAGECSMRIRGQNVKLVDPRLVADPMLRAWPGPGALRVIGCLGGVSEFLRMRG